MTFSRRPAIGPRNQPWCKICWLICAAAMAGCAEPGTDHVPESAAVHQDDQAEQDAIRYNIGRLPDRSYVRTYGGDEHPRPWYTAAEALGEIGKPAVPPLIERLDSPDAYEVMLALYALMLASQDPALQADTGGDDLRLGTVLTEESNAENRRLALDWWERYRHLWR